MQKYMNPIEEMYESRPRRWWIYTLIVLLFVILLGWSGTAIRYKGVAEKGSEVAYGIVYGVTHPDKSLLISWTEWTLPHITFTEQGMPQITWAEQAVPLLNMSEQGVPYLLFQTVAIAVLGTLIGGLLAVPFSFLASENIVPKWLAFLFRALILLIRTVPSLVWALVWIRVTGPGAFCGVLTQAICSIGMISKMYINAIQDLDTKILESLDAAGCTTFQKIRYGILPQLYANFVSTMVYRFDINIKDATTLGIVGAGGIGAALIQCIGSRRWSMVGAFLLGLVILMIFIELFSTRVRRKLARG